MSAQDGGPAKIGKPPAGYEYLRQSYGVDPRIGQRICFDGKMATVVRARPSQRHYLAIRIDGEKRNVIVHPTWRVDYAPAAPPARESGRAE